LLARYLMWRLVELAAFGVVMSIGIWALDGGLGRLLRAAPAKDLTAGAGTGFESFAAGALAAFGAMWPLALCGLAALALILATRTQSRRKRRYVRWRVNVYRTDEATAEGVVAMFESLHKRLARPWWQRVWFGQASASLEVHSGPDPAGMGAAGCGDQARSVWLAVSCPADAGPAVEATLRGAYPNCSLQRVGVHPGSPPVLIRLKKRSEFIRRVKVLDRYEHERSPAMNRLMTVMSTCPAPAYVQLALTPAPACIERHAAHAFKHHERRVTWRHRAGRPLRDRSLYDGRCSSPICAWWPGICSARSESLRSCAHRAPRTVCQNAGWRCGLVRWRCMTGG
jgi:hypothetical protein